ncbi:MAG: YoaK family protein [Intestinibaculum porci]|jgi:uncharacterized membrane protein YoaK (UPF0700 family)|uniref:YoaK family protein n=1 Tax=Intestinibaculum porci TaxID=2487118 RepID=UPI00240A3A6C|nr:YoaK family protein [Intestinibaculum porci]MDD6422408.1 YoaK family protein [Intestinibaculum porci]
MDDQYLECEKYYVFLMLICVAGFYGGYTLSVKGGIFANAQTANICLLGIAIGTHNFSKIYTIIASFTAYFLGTIFSEQTAWKLKHLNIIRWDTFLILLELILVTALGASASFLPDFIYPIVINFICAMQFNTFRQAEGVGMATTFVTNHVRQTGSWLVRYLRKRHQKKYLYRALHHFGMIIAFCVGAALSSGLGLHFGGHALLFADLPLAYLLFIFLRADLITERNVADKTPHGH